MNQNFTQELILVDDHDNVLGYAPREECHSGEGKRHRAIAVILYNSKGELLLQQRKALLWDNCWDTAGATHPLHLSDRDETYEEAANRFLRREWNIETHVKLISSFVYYEPLDKFCENEFCALFVGELNAAVRFNPEYAYGFRWCMLRQCQSEISIDPFSFTPWAKIALQILEKSESIVTRFKNERA